MKIVAFGHRSRQGKDTALKFLLTELKCTNRYKNIRKVPIAGALKESCYNLFKWDGMQPAEHYENHPEDRSRPLPTVGKTPVEIWIDFGTLVVRNLYDSLWIHYLLHTVTCDLLLINDLRFPNEVAAIKARGGYCIKVERPGIDAGLKNSIADDALNGWDGWDHVIVNDGSLNDLYKKSVNLIPQLGL